MVLIAQVAIYNENLLSEENFHTIFSLTLLIGTTTQLILFIILVGKQSLKLFNCHLLVPSLAS